MCFVFAEYFAENAANFAERAVSTYAVKDNRHQVDGFVSSCNFQLGQFFLNLCVITFCLNFSQFVLLEFAGGCVNLQEPSTGASSIVNLLTPTIVLSPDSTAICQA